MEIRHSLGRFLSIFFIVAIGCAFFSGIRASEPDMRYSGDAYFDEKNLMDIQVMSTMGLTEDDLDAIRAVDGVLDAEGSYATDVLCTIRQLLLQKSVAVLSVTVLLPRHQRRKQLQSVRLQQAYFP